MKSPPVRDGISRRIRQNGGPPDMVNCQRLLPGFVALLLCAPTVEGSSRRDSAAKLNTNGFDFAAALVAQNHFVTDKKGEWSSHHPARAQENDFIRDQGFPQYAKWHLAIDEEHAPTSKARYKFPFGDFQNVHRCGLLAIKSRAHQYGYQEIEEAATRLLEMIESARPSRQKRVD